MKPRSKPFLLLPHGREVRASLFEHAEKKGWQPVALELFEAAGLPSGIRTLRRFFLETPEKLGNVIFSSPRALDFFKDIHASSGTPSLGRSRAFCMGASSGAYAERLGFKTVFYPPEAQGGAALLELLIADGETATSFTYLHGRKKAFDMAAALQKIGKTCHDIPLYDYRPRRPPPPLPLAAIEALDSGRWALLGLSQETLKGTAAYLASTKRPPPLRAGLLLCLPPLRAEAARLPQEIFRQILPLEGGVESLPQALDLEDFFTDPL